MNIGAPALAIALAAILIQGAARVSSPDAPDRGHAISFEDIAQPKPGSWPTYNGHLSGNRFSPLDQINASNVPRLAPAWMFGIHRSPRELQVTPVVAGGVI